MSPASPWRVIKVRPAEILTGRRTFDASHGLRAHGDAGDHAQVGSGFWGTRHHPPVPCLRREPRIPARLGQEDGGPGPVRSLRPGEIRRGGTRLCLLRDYDRGAVPRRRECRGDRGGLQWARLRASPPIWNGGTEAAVSRAGRPRRGDRGGRAHGGRERIRFGGGWGPPPPQGGGKGP